MTSTQYCLRSVQPLVDQVDTDHPDVPVMCDPAGHRADRAEAEHQQRAALGHLRVFDGLPCGRQHIGQIHVALVGTLVGHLDVGVLRLGHPQVLSLPAGHLAVELGVAEQGGARALIAVLRGLALALQPLAAHEAVPAADVERDHHPIACREILDVASDFLDDTHGLVAEDVARAHERPEHLVQVKVGPTDVGARDPDDRIGRFLDHRVGHGVDGHLPPSLPRDCSHRNPP